MSGRTVAALGVVGGLLLSGALVWQSTEAAFTATTATPQNSWQTGSVVLSDDATSVAFDVTGLSAGQTGSRCITVTYDGSVVPADVRLYAADVVDGGLAGHLELAVREGTGGGFADCTGFVAGSGAATATVATFPTDFTTGWGTWAPATTGATRTYEIVYTVAAGAPQGASAGIAFVWEARG